MVDVEVPYLGKLDYDIAMICSQTGYRNWATKWQQSDTGAMATESCNILILSTDCPDFCSLIRQA